MDINHLQFLVTTFNTTPFLGRNSVPVNFSFRSVFNQQKLFKKRRSKALQETQYGVCRNKNFSIPQSRRPTRNGISAAFSPASFSTPFRRISSLHSYEGRCRTATRPPGRRSRRETWKVSYTCNSVSDPEELEVKIRYSQARNLSGSNSFGRSQLSGWRWTANTGITTWTPGTNRYLSIWHSWTHSRRVKLKKWTLRHV